MSKISSNYYSVKQCPLYALLIFSFLCMLFPALLFAQNNKDIDREIIEMMNNINLKPTEISFKSTIPVNNNGGHIQAIQYLQYQNQDYYFLSGSSDSYSYYSIVATKKNNAVISVNKILDNPYRHAGGFQISKGLMAIGIEDNYLKDKSMVYIYEINNPNKPPSEPLHIIQRRGIAKRVTAGCVGIIEIENHILVVVGNWDTKHLDFYRLHKDKLHTKNEQFELITTIELATTDKTQWVDTDWLSYQNINLIADSSGTIYLAGMATKKGAGNFLDMYRLTPKGTSDFQLTKIHSRTFPESEISKFEWGAGIYSNKNQQLKVFSTGEHFTPTATLLRFE
jgi:hypothetical protein